MSDPQPPVERWVKMSEAARELGVAPSTLSRLAALKAFEVRTRIANRRDKLVNVEEVRRVLTETI